MEERIYCCIDLKSFYASVECVERGLDPFKVNLIVADPTRGSGTVCLAITPKMKELGVKNRCRVYEIPKKIEYIMAKPQMKLYMQKSYEIYSIYLKYISPDDIHVYSVDECFIDLTDYIKLYGESAKELAEKLRSAVYAQTGICATVGIGTNLFLAKIALDITAKKSPDFMGYLDEKLFKETLWHHKPLTDFWNIGAGIAKRLNRLGLMDMYAVAHCPEQTLYKEFGINAEFIIDHSKGVETCTMADIKNYKTKSNSLSNGQVLFSDYSYADALTVMKEMAFALTLELNEKDLVTNCVSLRIGYADRSMDFVGGSVGLDNYTSSYKIIEKNLEMLFNKFVDKNIKIRRINIGFNNIIKEEYTVYSLFSDGENLEKEKKLLGTVAGIRNKYGKNALLRGISYSENATARERNKMIGGHNAGQDE